MSSIEKNSAPVKPYGNQFDFDFDSSVMPNQICRAAEALTDLVINGFSQNWADCSEPEHIEQQRKAVRTCRRMLKQIDVIIEHSASRAVRHYKRQIEAVEKAVKA